MTPRLTIGLALGFGCLLGYVHALPPSVGVLVQRTILSAAFVALLAVTYTLHARARQERARRALRTGRFTRWLDDGGTRSWL